MWTGKPCVVSTNRLTPKKVRPYRKQVYGRVTFGMLNRIFILTYPFYTGRSNIGRWYPINGTPPPLPLS